MHEIENKVCFGLSDGPYRISEYGIAAMYYCMPKFRAILFKPCAPLIRDVQHVPPRPDAAAVSYGHCDPPRRQARPG